MQPYPHSTQYKYSAIKNRYTMNTQIVLIVLVSMVIISCKRTESIHYSIGEGFEIYQTETPYIDNLEIDYSKLNFDTIVLMDKPILKYNGLIKYDTISHKLTLGISHDSLKIGDASVYGRMCVVTIDREAIYCLFKWPVISSIPCNWVYIEEPYSDLDHLSDKEIVISFSTEQYTDPRLDRRIVKRLIRDGKIN